MCVNYSHIQAILIVLTIAGCSGTNGKTGINSDKFKLPKRFTGIDTSVEAELGNILKKYKPADLFIGAPDYLPPTFVRSSMYNVTTSDDVAVDQYSSSEGETHLREVIARVYSDMINRELDPHDNVVITVGSSEGLFTILQSHTLPGDEWILIEPFFIPYENLVEMAGGVVRVVSLKQKTATTGRVSSKDWVFDKKKMARAFNRKTKGILLNTPHNPTGKVFTMEEMQFIADLAIKWNTLVIADEVYEWMIYPPNKLVRMATLPNMFKRTISVSSASKTLSVTGWRIGWLYGPPNLLKNIKTVHARVVYSNPTPAQVAVATALDTYHRDMNRPGSYMHSYIKELESKRNFIVDVLEKIGMSPTVPDGTFYVYTNWTALSSRANFQDEKGEFLDVKFIKWLVKKVGVIGAPATPFYSRRHKQYEEDYLRFCFARRNDGLTEAARRLLAWNQQR